MFEYVEANCDQLKRIMKSKSFQVGGRCGKTHIKINQREVQIKQIKTQQIQREFNDDWRENVIVECAELIFINNMNRKKQEALTWRQNMKHTHRKFLWWKRPMN